MKFYTDTGSRFTILPPDEYRTSMGKVVAADTILRGWGPRKPLDMKRGWWSQSWSQIMEPGKGQILYCGGHKPEALLREEDVEDLGLIRFNPDGREPS